MAKPDGKRPATQDDGQPAADEQAPLAPPPSLERPDQLEADRVRAAIRRRLFDAPAPPPKLGRYEVRGRIGAGAMGAVFVARDGELERDVALKVMRPRSSGEQAKTVRRRLLREARAMARLRHPNVIAVHEAGIVDDQAFIAMELVEGTTLRKWLDAQSPSQQAVLDVFVQAGQGLAAAHDAGLVHRDFKPDNVLIGEDGRVQVTDFGVVRALEAEQEDGPRSQQAPSVAGGRAPGGSVATEYGRAGTPRYMAPEQHAGAAVDARADQFSFCVALFEALAGEPPFAGTTVEELSRATQQGTIRETDGARSIPRWLMRVLERGLQSDPARRYPSMQALLEDLRADRAVPRRWAAPAALATAVLAVGVAVTWGYGTATTASETRPPATTTSRAGASAPPLDAAPSVAASSNQSAPTSTSVVLEGFATTAIEEGRVPDGNTWVPAFPIVRHEGDENATYLEAQEACRTRAMALCTEAQWSRACSVEARLAALESWTASAVTDRGFVVRGGQQRCTARRIARAAERSPLRVGACCGRAVGIVSDQPSKAFLRTTSQKLLKIDTAISQGNSHVLSSFVDDQLTYLTRKMPRDAFLTLAQGAYRQFPDQWLMHDVCVVSLVATGGQNAWTADCRSVAHQGGKLAHLVRRYVFGGPEGRLQAIGEPTVYRGFAAP